MPRYIHLEQSGPDWHRWRLEGIGGSDACAVMGDVTWTSPDELLEVKLGLREVATNPAMERGKRLEPEARLRYQHRYGHEIRPVCVQHDEYPWLRASLDGITQDGQLVVEIKCPTTRWGHWRVLKKRQIPNYYRAQVQHQLLVTQAPRLHFVSYHPDEFTGNDVLAVVEVLPDPEYQRKLFKAEKRFWEQLRAHRRIDLSRPAE